MFDFPPSLLLSVYTAVKSSFELNPFHLLQCRHCGKWFTSPRQLCWFTIIRWAINYYPLGPFLHSCFVVARGRDSHSSYFCFILKHSYTCTYIRTYIHTQLVSIIVLVPPSSSSFTIFLPYIISVGSWSLIKSFLSLFGHVTMQLQS